jgi:hypothetical protein
LLVPAPAPASPIPALIPTPAPPSEATIRAALASAADPKRCALVDLQREGSLVTIGGFVHQSEAELLQQPLRAAGLTPRLQAEVFDAPFCAILAALRPAAATQATPRVAARATHLRNGERLTLDFDMANWPSVVNLWFVMHDGTTLQLLANQRMAAGERRMMDQTRPDFPWVIGEPFGHEMVIMLASDTPPFAAPRPLEESIDSLTAALQDAIRRAPAEGRRLVGQAVMVHRAQWLVITSLVTSMALTPY